MALRLAMCVGGTDGSGDGDVVGISVGASVGVSVGCGSGTCVVGLHVVGATVGAASMWP